MITSSLQKSSKSKQLAGSTKPHADTCLKCGGNGYTKSSPDCYKTCIDCLGMGLVLEKN